jgi:predicted membrane-bound mannosyltransferase
MAGIRDALGAYGAIASRLVSGDTGHEKPWWYFIRLFAWQRRGGLLFEQAGFLALVVCGFVVALAGGAALLRWAAAYSALVLLALSATPYKTPWHAIHLVPGFAILAAGALTVPPRDRSGRIGAAAVALAVLALLCFQTDRVTRAYPSDERNPYAYVHSSPDVLKIRALADAARGRLPGSPIRVISEEYWPLPWYLRGMGGVGYWTAPPADCDGTLVIASADLEAAVRRRLHGAYDRSYLGLRPGFALVVFTARP